MPQKTSTFQEENNRNIFLYLVAVILQLISFTAGAAFCWTTPVSSRFQSPETSPLLVALSTDEISWLASLIALGAIPGPFLGGYLADFLGRKQTLLCTAVLEILSYAMLAFGTHLYMYYLARFVGGIGIGVVLTVIPIYMGEISEIHNRGTLGSLMGVFITLGNFSCFAIGPYLSVRMFSLTCMIPPVIFVILCIPLIPESPCFLIMKGRHEEARNSLTKLRSGKDAEIEFIDLTATVKESLANSGGISDIFKARSLYKGLIIIIGLMIIQQITAISAILLYMDEIFEKAGSSLPKQIATMLVGVVQIVATISAAAVVDRLGRRPLILSSSIISSISLLILGLYFYLLIKIDVSTIAWLPLVALIVYIFFYNIGIGPLPYTVMGEIFPPHVRSTASSVSVTCVFLFCFSVAKIFPILVDLVDNWFAFTVFGMCNALGVVFIWCQLPETKGKTLVEILEALK